MGQSSDLRICSSSSASVGLTFVEELPLLGVLVGSTGRELDERAERFDFEHLFVRERLEIAAEIRVGRAVDGTRSF